MGDKRTYKDRRTYLIQAVQKRRRKLREKAIDYKGGHCQVCGYSNCLEALEFHHLQSNGKDFGISDKGYTRSWKKIAESIKEIGEQSLGEEGVTFNVYDARSVTSVTLPAQD